MTKYTIIDWANNPCFHERTFDDFDDAEGFLSIVLEAEILVDNPNIETSDDISDKLFSDYRGVYYIVEVKQHDQ